MGIWNSTPGATFVDGLDLKATAAAVVSAGRDLVHETRYDF